MFFFFQAEDGIRDYKVTGVQTCALPISSGTLASFSTIDAIVTRSLRLIFIATADESHAGFHRLSNEYTISRTACRDRKSTRLNSSHLVISYAVFCLKKKKNKTI